jgi:hypothetical protein
VSGGAGHRGTDTLYACLAGRAKLETLMTIVLPGHRLAGSRTEVGHREDRAAPASAVRAPGVHRDGGVWIGA